MDNNKITKEFIYKCEKQRKKNEKKLKPLTQDDIMKYEIAQELGLLDKVDEKGWAGSRKNWWNPYISKKTIKKES